MPLALDPPPPLKSRCPELAVQPTPPVPIVANISAEKEHPEILIDTDGGEVYPLPPDINST